MYYTKPHMPSSEEGRRLFAHAPDIIAVFVVEGYDFLSKEKTYTYDIETQRLPLSTLPQYVIWFAVSAPTKTCY